MFDRALPLKRLSSLANDSTRRSDSCRWKAKGSTNFGTTLHFLLLSFVNLEGDGISRRKDWPPLARFSRIRINSRCRSRRNQRRFFVNFRSDEFFKIFVSSYFCVMCIDRKKTRWILNSVSVRYKGIANMRPRFVSEQASLVKMSLFRRWERILYSPFIILIFSSSYLLLAVFLLSIVLLNNENLFLHILCLFLLLMSNASDPIRDSSTRPFSPGRKLHAISRARSVNFLANLKRFHARINARNFYIPIFYVSLCVKKKNVLSHSPSYFSSLFSFFLSNQFLNE